MKAPDLSLEEASRQALLLLESGDTEQAEALARQILRFPPLPTLWTREHTYKPRMSAFEELRGRLGGMETIEQDRERGFQLLPMGALTLTGLGNGLGTLQFGEVEVRTFGPQWAPWSDTEWFGIEMPPPYLGKWGEREARAWIRPRKTTIPTWIEVGARWNERSISLDFRVMGLPREPELGMAFYISAAACRLEGTTLKPGGLQSYRGRIQQVDFGAMQLRISEPLEGEVIPLSGSGSFWNAHFLVVTPLTEETVTYTLSST